jgi:hypothetical protein
VKRNSKGESESAVAQRASVEPEQIHRIERGDLTMLSFGEFAEICRRGYGVDSAYDFPDPSEPVSPFLHINADTPCRVWQGDSVGWRHFLEHLEGSHLRPEFLVLPPRRKRTGAGITARGKHLGEELLYVISGEILMNIRDESSGKWNPPIRLCTGEICHFKSVNQHWVENARTAQEARFLVVRYQKRK